MYIIFTYWAMICSKFKWAFIFTYFTIKNCPIDVVRICDRLIYQEKFVPFQTFNLILLIFPIVLISKFTSCFILTWGIIQIKPMIFYFSYITDKSIEFCKVVFSFLKILCNSNKFVYSLLCLFRRYIFHAF